VGTVEMENKPASSHVPDRISRKVDSSAVVPAAIDVVGGSVDSSGGSVGSGGNEVDTVVVAALVDAVVDAVVVVVVDAVVVDIVVVALVDAVVDAVVVVVVDAVVVDTVVVAVADAGVVAACDAVVVVVVGTVGSGVVVAGVLVTKLIQTGVRGLPSERKAMPLPALDGSTSKKTDVPRKVKQPSGVPEISVTRTAPPMPRALAASTQAIPKASGDSPAVAQLPPVTSS
jgi:hypothetical protein